MPQAGVQTFETPCRSSNSDWADEVEITVLRDRTNTRAGRGLCRADARAAFVGIW
jgi:hypothetical protein